MKRSWTKNAIVRIHKQRWIILAFCVVLSLVLVLGITFAWFTSSDEKKNPFKTPDFPFSIVITEEFTPPGTVDPGESIPKVVKVTNTGELPGFVRVLVLTEIIGQDGTVLPGNAPTQFTFEGMNTTDWKDGGDGYYYYMNQLKPGDVSPELFTGVKIDAGLGDEYKNAGMKIEVKLEAVEIAKWKYREGWWGSNSAPSAPQLVAVDNALSALAS